MMLTRFHDLSATGDDETLKSNETAICVLVADVQRAFPDYYETIKVPMSLEIVHQRLEDGSYDTLKAVVADIGQIFNNAKRCKLVGVAMTCS
jgi:hypothetical protein